MKGKPNYFDVKNANDDLESTYQYWKTEIGKKKEKIMKIILQRKSRLIQRNKSFLVVSKRNRAARLPLINKICQPFENNLETEVQLQGTMEPIFRQVGERNEIEAICHIFNKEYLGIDDMHPYKSAYQTLEDIKKDGVEVGNMFSYLHALNIKIHSYKYTGAYFTHEADTRNEISRFNTSVTNFIEKHK